MAGRFLHRLLLAVGPLTGYLLAEYANRIGKRGLLRYVESDEAEERSPAGASIRAVLSCHAAGKDCPPKSSGRDLEYAVRLNLTSEFPVEDLGEVLIAKCALALVHRTLTHVDTVNKNKRHRTLAPEPSQTLIPFQTPFPTGQIRRTCRALSGRQFAGQRSGFKVQTPRAAHSRRQSHFSRVRR